MRWTAGSVHAQGCWWGSRHNRSLAFCDFIMDILILMKTWMKKQKCILDMTSKYIKPTSMRVWNTLEVEESFGKNIVLLVLPAITSWRFPRGLCWPFEHGISYAFPFWHAQWITSIHIYIPRTTRTIKIDGVFFNPVSSEITRFCPSLQVSSKKPGFSQSCNFCDFAKWCLIFVQPFKIMMHSICIAHSCAPCNTPSFLAFSRSRNRLQPNAGAWPPKCVQAHGESPAAVPPFSQGETSFQWNLH